MSDKMHSYWFSGGWNNNPTAWTFRKTMRRMMVHAGHLPSRNGNCVIFDETDEDWVEQPASLSDIVSLGSPAQDTLPIEQHDLSTIGYMSG